MLPSLKIDNFGPIRHIEVEFSKYTVFIGHQGSGKSTIAKLYSMFTWLEKRLERGMLTVGQIEGQSRFSNSISAYSRLSEFFKEDTRIEYRGRFYSFCYDDKQMKVTKLDEPDQEAMSKVLYVPAERNFLTAIGTPSNVKSLPESVTKFLEDFEMAKATYSTGFRLPLTADAEFEYDKLNELSWIKGSDYRIRLSAASSGFQSALSLCLVTQYIADKVENSKNDPNALTMAERSIIAKEVAQIMADDTLSGEVKNAALKSLSNRFGYSEFINIVEEPEQNLYPTAQKDILFYLIATANRIENNKLVVTTHSPFIINYLTLATKAYTLSQMAHEKGREDAVEEIARLVPAESSTNPDLLRIYQLCNGSATPLPHAYGLPSDANLLNLEAGATNDIFGEMLDIEEDLSYEG